MPAFNACLPNFMIIGAAKAGTTSLYAYLRQHPEIFLPKEKETHFFDTNALYEQGVDYYISHFFRGAEAFLARGDATPAYLRLPKLVIPRIQTFYNGQPLRFVVLLRDPVARAWSHYLHTFGNGDEALSFEAALQAEDDRLAAAPERWCGYFHDGLYAEQLSAWFHAFERENFFVGLLDDLAANPHLFLENLFSFLGVTPDFRPELARQNEAREARSRFVMKLFRANIVGKERIKALLPPLLLRRLRIASRTWNVRPMQHKPVMDPKTATQLRARYAPSICKLEQLLGKSFAQWLPNESEMAAANYQHH